MGIILPDEAPTFNPTQQYFVNYRAHDIAGCGNWIGNGNCLLLGSDLNAYYAAGGDCVLGNHVCPGIPEPSTQVVNITES